jgi:hypothetical protein
MMAASTIDVERVYAYGPAPATAASGPWGPYRNVSRVRISVKPSLSRRQLVAAPTQRRSCGSAEA